MYNTSPKFKESIYAPVRSATGRVTFDISDTTASGDVTNITVTSESALSVKNQLINKVRNPSNKTITMEKDRLLLDGSFSFADETLDNNGELGWSSSKICQPDGNFDQWITGDYAGKIAGSTVENPNILLVRGSSTLQPPSGFTEVTQAKYNGVMTLNGSYYTDATTSNLSMVQKCFSFDLVSIIERTNGISLGANLAAKVATLKSIITMVYCIANVKGSSPAGNKAFVDVWNVSLSAWHLKYYNVPEWVQNTTANIAPLSTGAYSNADCAIFVDNNGFVHFLAYAEPSNGTVASSVSTDKMEIVIILGGAQTLTFDFASNHSSAGLTVTFDPINNEYATDFDMTAYDSTGAVIDTVAITGNTDVISVPLGQLYNYRKVSVTIKKWSKPNRRARVMEVDFGFVKQYNDDQLISMNLVEEMDMLTGKLPSAEFKFTIDNSERLFNILNPTGFYKYLQQKQQVIGEIGLELDNGVIEYVPIGNYLLQEWQSDEGSLTATFTARTNLDLMSSFDYENLTAIPNKTLYELAEDMFSLCGLGGVPQSVAFNQEWTTNPYTIGATTVNSTGGTLNVTSNSSDSMIEMYSLGSFNPATYRYIEIKYRVVSGIPNAPEIFYTNSRYTTANGGQVVGAGAYPSPSYINDGLWHVMYVDMWTHPDWKLYGNITGWRFDWCTASGVTMEFDYIKLVDKPRGNPQVYSIDPALQTITTTALVEKKNCRDVLQMIAIAGCANVYVTRDNKITLKCSNTRPVRYIRDWLNGSNANASSHWVEIQAFNTSGVNVALGKSVTLNAAVQTGTVGLVTNGDTTAATGTYLGTSDVLPSVVIDLGSVVEIKFLKVWHYYADGRIYNNTKTEVSTDGVTWFPVFDSATEGTYAETSSGRTYYMDGVSKVMPAPVDAADFDNMYNEPQISLDKAVKRVEVTHFANLSTAAIVGVNSDVNTLGDTIKLEKNTLINDSTRARTVANWFLNQLKYRATYRVNWRGNPAIELNDVMSFENTYGGDMSAYVTRNEIDYAGYLAARTQAKGVVN